MTPRGCLVGFSFVGTAAITVGLFATIGWQGMLMILAGVGGLLLGGVVLYAVFDMLYFDRWDPWNRP